MLAFPTRPKMSMILIDFATIVVSRMFNRLTGYLPGFFQSCGIKHLRPVIAPVADGRVGRLHNHLVRVVGMEKIERRARVASFVVDA